MKQSHNPKVSVIIPVYNAEKYLQQCLDSVLSQSLKEIEVICVDDGSKDSSLDILRHYENNDSRVTIIVQENQFAGIARNKGIAAASGKYCAFLDSDDFMEEDVLEKLYHIAEERNLDFIKTKSYVLDESTQETKIEPYYVFDAFGKKNFNKVFSFYDLPTRALAIADVPWNGLYRTAFLDENNIRFNHLRCANDRSFFIHCMIKAKRFMVSDLFMTCYRVNLKESLIGVRNLHFECQTESYQIIRRIVNENKPQYAQIILQRELDNLFYWRKHLKREGRSIKNEAEIMFGFISTFDVSDVGKAYLERSTYYNDYLHYIYDNHDCDDLICKIRFKRAILRQGLRLCKEYGIRYVLKRLV